jgi:hypothetical protein
MRGAGIVVTLMAELCGQGSGPNQNYKPLSELKKTFGCITEGARGNHTYGGSFDMSYLDKGYEECSVDKREQIEWVVDHLSFLGITGGRRPEVFISTHGSVLKAMFGDNGKFLSCRGWLLEK